MPATARREDPSRARAVPISSTAHEINISVSIGISPYVPGIAGADAMLVQADLALYRSKEEGRNQYHFHSADLDQEVLDRVTLAGEIKRAIDQRRIRASVPAAGRVVVRNTSSAWKRSCAGITPRAACCHRGSSSRSPRRPAPSSRWGTGCSTEACRQMSLWRDRGTEPVRDRDQSLLVPTQMRSGARSATSPRRSRNGDSCRPISSSMSPRPRLRS